MSYSGGQDGVPPAAGGGVRRAAAHPSGGARRRPHAPDHRRMPRFYTRVDALGGDIFWAVVPEFWHDGDIAAADFSAGGVFL